MAVLRIGKLLIMRPHLGNDAIIIVHREDCRKDSPYLMSILIGDDEIFTIEFTREPDGSLYYRVEESANPEFVIEGHYPEYFEED